MELERTRRCWCWCCSLALRLIHRSSVSFNFSTAYQQRTSFYFSTSLQYTHSSQFYAELLRKETYTLFVWGWLSRIENGWMKKGWKSLAYGVWNRSENVGKTKIVLNGPCSNFFPIMRIAKQIWVRVVKYLNKVVYRHFGAWGENVKLNFIWQEY